MLRGNPIDGGPQDLTAYNNDQVTWLVVHKFQGCPDIDCQAWYRNHYPEVRDQLRQRGFDPDLLEVQAVLSV